MIERLQSRATCHAQQAALTKTKTPEYHLPKPLRLVKRNLREEIMAVEEKIIATYGYKDESGQLLYKVVRFEPKDFRQRRPDGKGGWKLFGVMLRQYVDLKASGGLENG
ncbi:MAG: hypothetical protein ACYS30_10525 [Planctomycetota bacterium]|jgi:hypothetical protein